METGGFIGLTTFFTFQPLQSLFNLLVYKRYRIAEGVQSTYRRAYSRPLPVVSGGLSGWQEAHRLPPPSRLMAGARQYPEAANQREDKNSHISHPHKETLRCLYRRKVVLFLAKTTATRNCLLTCSSTRTMRKLPRLSHIRTSVAARTVPFLIDSLHLWKVQKSKDKMVVATTKRNGIVTCRKSTEDRLNRAPQTAEDHYFSF